MTAEKIMIDSHWEEIRRPGHIVRIVDIESLPALNAYIVYAHVGVHNKRVQTANTITPLRSFRRRFRPCDASMPIRLELQANRDEIENLRAQLASAQAKQAELHRAWRELEEGQPDA